MLFGQVSASYAMAGSPQSDQGAVWGEVSRKMKAMGHPLPFGLPKSETESDAHAQEPGDRVVLEAFSVSCVESCASNRVAKADIESARGFDVRRKRVSTVNVGSPSQILDDREVQARRVVPDREELLGVCVPEVCSLEDGFLIFADSGHQADAVTEKHPAADMVL